MELRWHSPAVVWCMLCGLTLLSVALVEEGWHRSFASVVIVLIAAVKSRLVIVRFMEAVSYTHLDSPLSYGKWFPAFWLIANAKNGISSYEIHRALGVTQKTAWFMLGRLREVAAAMGTLGGPVSLSLIHI